MKNEKLFERSEFFSFRKNLHFLALEREPANFLFVSVFLLFGQKKNERKHTLIHHHFIHKEPSRITHTIVPGRT